MSRKRHPLKTITRLSTRFIRRFLAKAKKQLIWLLRTVFGTHKKQQAANAGFVLPTVVMVSVVVVLLTTAIMFRSFDRAKNASNVRVNEAVINAGSPAIDRARAKINKLFQDPALPRATPSDLALYDVLTNTNVVNNDADDNIKKYTFGDETPLKLTFEFNGQTGIQESTASLPIPLNSDETVRTAWRFPIDTDNNGKFDSYTLYGIYFRTPPVGSNGQYSRARNALEARTPPMNLGTGANPLCGEGTSATLVGNTGWVQDGSKLKKAFFVYTATVPITSTATIPSDNSSNFEVYKGNKSFSALEYQQDKIQLPPTNNAVVYEDDLAITLGSTAFRLNGRVMTNGNLLTGAESGVGVRFFQVSAPPSCFYEAENAKIIVGGNLGAGKFTNIRSGDGTAGTAVFGDLPTVTTADLYRGSTNSTVNWQKSVTTTDNSLIAYNSLAYTQRINRLVSAQFANNATTDPPDVTSAIVKAKLNSKQQTFTSDEDNEIRRQQLELYFKKLTRRVPFAEVAFNGNAVSGYSSTSPLTGSGATLRPVDAWAFPTDPTDGKTGTGYTGLSLALNGSDKLIPAATETTTLTKAPYGGNEQTLGDRALLGNNLPGLWIKDGSLVGPYANDTQNISGVKWDIDSRTIADAQKLRSRRSRVQILADLGSTDRDSDWEQAASKIPSDTEENVGGLRLVTGAGIYLPANYPASTTFANFRNEIWSDMMWVNPPATPTTLSAFSLYDPALTFTSPTRPLDQPYLRMRATAVYHYKATNYSASNPTPIACISSYYDPTNENTARNGTSFPKQLSGANGNVDLSNARYDVSPYVPTGATRQGLRSGGLSNNGIVYGPPTKSYSDYTDILTYQKGLTYANGRSIDDGLLAGALTSAKIATPANRSLSEKAAIDAQICALQILDGSISPVDSAVFSDGVINHGAILETAFLDSRQVKQISADPTSQTYDMPLRNRQPLEIRTTVLNIDSLRQEIIGSSTPVQEYMLPNSGIIYATRDDALPDISSPLTDPVAKKLESPVDYKLDPTRRPNGIMLVNGSKIFRGLTNTFTAHEKEKGFILASNLPAYIRGNFNLHTKLEFTTALDDTWSNFYTRTTLDPNFACRPNDPRLSQCTTGDEWRPAAVLADAVTLLSDNFRVGFRREGDYDWNNNLGDSSSVSARPTNFGYNSYVPNFTWYGSDLFPIADLDSGRTGSQGSSYLNNFVTPIVRRVPIPELATEVCVPSTRTRGNDNKNDEIGNGTGTMPDGTACTWTLTTAGSANGNGSRYKEGQPDQSLKTGTLATAPDPDYANLPRRIAYIRNADASLATPLKVFGIAAADSKLKIFTVDDNFPLKDSAATVRTSTTATMPWLKASLTGGNVVYTPVLQVERPLATSTSPSNTDSITGSNDKRWLQYPISDTEFNLVIVAGDAPARPEEDNGGLPNFPRFMENWSNTALKAKISGSFIQSKKSAYATGPFSTSLTSQGSDFYYRIGINNGRGSGYLPPTRVWGYDVGLLSQSPDAFSQKLVLSTSDAPNEYFREVGRDDTWVRTLLCGKTSATDYAVDADQRSGCP